MTSEQALSNLERSKEPFIQLIDKALDILGRNTAQQNLHVTSAATSSKSDSANFRGQWVLRWLIKKLSQEVDGDAAAVSADKAWLLLNHLLHSIPTTQLRDILIERRFAELLGRCLEYLHRVEFSKDGKISRLSSTDAENPSAERPAKRRKLSNDTVSQFIVTQTRIDVLLATSAALGSQLSEIDRVSSNARWADSTEAANKVLSQVLNYTSGVLTILDDTPTDSIAKLFRCIDQWLELWINFKPAKPSKQITHTLFSELLLRPILGLLQLRSRFAIQGTFSTLERLVATRTVIPCREAFETSLKAQKLTGASQVSREQAVAIAQDISKPLGNGVATLVGDKGVCSHLLLSIAERIVPRTDIPRRRAETLWFEAFHFALQLLSGSKHKIDLETKQADLETIYDSIFAPEAEERPACGSLLNTFSDLNLEPTSVFWREFVRRSLSSKRTKLEDLSKIVGINSAIFVASGEENVLLHLLGKRADTLDPAHLTLYITETILPVLTSYGRARQLPEFVAFWKIKLEDDIETQDEELATRLVPRSFWDDPRLCKAFEIACRQSNHFSFFDQFLNDLNKMLSAAGSGVANHGTNTCVVIASPMLQALDGSNQGQELISKHAEGIFGGTVTILKLKSMAASLQWRFWGLLGTMVRLGALEVNYGDLKQDKLSWPSSKLTRDPDTNNLSRMAFYNAFHLGISLFQQSEADFQSLFEDYAVSITKLYREARSSIQEGAKTEVMDDLETGWNSSVQDMNSHWKLISACLYRMTALPMALLVNIPRINEILSTLIEISSLGISSNGHSLSMHTNVVVAAEAILNMTVALPKVDLLKLFLDYHTRQIDPQWAVLPERIPKFVQGIADGKLKKAPAKKLLQTLLDICSRPTLTVEGYIQCLSVIHTLVNHRPASFGDSWDQFQKCTVRTTEGFTLAEFVAAGALIEKLSILLVNQMIAQAQQGSTSNLSSALRWTLHEVTKHGKNLRSSFRGIGAVALVNCEDLIEYSTGSDVDHSIMTDIKALRDGLQANVLESAKKLIKKSPDAAQCLMAWKFLEALAHGEPDKTLLTEAVDLIETIGRETHALQPNEEENHSTALARGGMDYLASQVTQSDATYETQAFMNGLVSSTSQYNGKTITKSGSAYATEQVTDDFVRLLNVSPNLDSTVKHVQPYLALANFIQNLDTDKFARSPEIIPGLHKLVYLDGAVTETSAEALLFRLEISKLILDKQSKLVNQHVVDSILQALTVLSSSTSKSKISLHQNGPEASHVFDRLCTIISALLIRYRQRLNGRYHLLLPGLQNLLKCLFYPPSQSMLNMTSATYASKAAFLESLPHWLYPRENRSSTALPPGSAAKFSRILQTLCDPSASSAHHALRRKSGQDKSNNLGLVDETKVLQRQVSQHTQYLLQTYCQSTLDGYIALEVREKLLPGVFAVMGATDIEILRGVNAGMNESQRAIWRDLYSDWRRSAK